MQKYEVFAFHALPESKEDLSGYSLTSPFETAALALAVLYRFEQDEAKAFELLDYLKGPAPTSPYERSFIKERLKNKGYKIASFFEGSSPANSYQPQMPLTIKVYETPYSYPAENWATLYVQSSGADHLRGIKLRCKPSTGQWFLNELQCLSDIRTPAADDPWE